MLKTFIRHKEVGILSLTALLLSVGGFVWTYFALRGITSTPLILHFDDISGVTAIGGMGTIIFLGIFGIAVTVINLFIAIELDIRDRFMGKLTAALTLLFAVLLFIAFAAIINVN